MITMMILQPPSLSLSRLIFVEYGVCSVLMLIIVAAMTRRLEKRGSTESAEKEFERKGGADLGQPGKEDEEQSLLRGRDAGASERNGCPVGMLPLESEVPPNERKLLGLSAGSLKTVIKISLLLCADSFAGSLVTGTLMAYYFKVITLHLSMDVTLTFAWRNMQLTYNVSMSELGGKMFGTDVISGVGHENQEESQCTFEFNCPPNAAQPPRCVNVAVGLGR